MYLKTSKSSIDLAESLGFFSANLSKGEKIKSFEVIDNENILILIDKGGDIKAAIYNVKKNAIIRILDR